MYDVVTFGETMVRLKAPGFQRLEQASHLELGIGGTELNMACGLARLGLRATWVSKLVDNPLGRYVANKARELGVDTSHIVWTNEGRVGLYFIEQGAQPRATSLIYDRKQAAITTLQPGEVDWPAIFAEARLFHTTGINPALGPNVARETEVAMAAAKAAGCRVSFDPNMRFTLWTVDEAKAAFAKLMPYVDVFFASAEALDLFYGIKGEPVEAALAAKERFGLEVVVLGRRESIGQLRGAWSSIAVADRVYAGERREFEVVDRVGAGDAFTAGFLFGYLQGDLQKAVEWADAMCALKHTVPGDQPWLDKADVEAVLAGANLNLRR